MYWGTPLTFDPSWIEFLIAWFSKACLIIVPPDVRLNPITLYKALFVITKVTFIQVVPSIFMQWNDVYIEKILSCEHLKILAFGGEVFPKSCLKYKRSKKLRIFNLYGITEVSCWASVHEIEAEIEESNIPLGKCIGDTILEVRDNDGTVLDTGRGEIFIGL